jgi:hypothetical protein
VGLAGIQLAVYGNGGPQRTAEGRSLAVRVTSRVQVGRFLFEIGAPEGTRADLATVAAGENPGELALALSQPPPAGASRGAAETLVDTESVTGRVEQALELFTGLAQGSIDRVAAVRGADALMATLERLDRQQRPADAYRLAHALTGSLALLGRWTSLVQALRIAHGAALALRDKAGEAWARHELGTFAIGAEEADAAVRELEEARRIRHKLRDEAGQAVTEHNLATARRAFGLKDSGWSKPLIAAAIIGGVLLLGAIGAGIALLVGNGDDNTAVDTVTPVVSFDKTPDNPTEERSASFEFSADEDVDRFECSLDGAGFEQCASPRNLAGPLSFGEHAFAVRAVDLAGNRGKAETHRWTVERGQGPTVTITNGPDPLTKQRTATFEMSGPDAARLECHVDGDDFERCSSPFTVQVDEGEHVFVVRGVDEAGTTGPEATYEWTVDTTAPTVDIENAERTSDTEAEVSFTPSESETGVRCALFESTDLKNAVDEVRDCTSPVKFTDLDPATSYVVRVTATDAAGNVGEAAEADLATFSP